LQTSAYGVAPMMVGRFITGMTKEMTCTLCHTNELGIGTGIETSTVPMYQSELAPANIRGMLVCSEPLFVGVGYVKHRTASRVKLHG